MEEERRCKSQLRSSREWLVGSQNGLLENTGLGNHAFHPECRQTGVQLKESNQSINSQQSRGRRVGLGDRPDSDKLDSYITVVLSENELLKSRNVIKSDQQSKMDAEITRLVERLKEMEDLFKQRTALATNVEERSNNRKIELKRLEDQNVSRENN